MMQNDPAHKGEAVNCILAGCIDGHIATQLRLQRLKIAGVAGFKADVIARLAWGGVA